MRYYKTVHVCIKIIQLDLYVLANLAIGCTLNNI